MTVFQLKSNELIFLLSLNFYSKCISIKINLKIFLCLPLIPLLTFFLLMFPFDSSDNFSFLMFSGGSIGTLARKGLKHFTIFLQYLIHVDLCGTWDLIICSKCNISHCKIMKTKETFLTLNIIFLTSTVSSITSKSANSTKCPYSS